MPPAKFHRRVAKANQLKAKLTRYQLVGQERRRERDIRIASQVKPLLSKKEPRRFGRGPEGFLLAAERRRKIRSSFSG
ncbi:MULTISPECIES: hypothetical protein [Rhizobium]|uniref:hypothetical protein n=1 Tax=Rhizobium TaxID=379 RepID=UPI001B344858|nr:MULTISPECIES: hypothetical protein [Rhizobium]MBX4910159.1 hypothetical protein [Rhizobium bangladeshense]MBX5220723.1 hypothetical protein [Rhizobium sp. NLR8a]MBX5237008.1 hypothetical protein [Rhizobium sp. NLR22b]MBX5249310.1 hypothetical protein [Rhizobium sp. NLR4b]MBX5259290.1 hypothetical protein [Rhizobium sp. NLR16b]